MKKLFFLSAVLVLLLFQFIDLALAQDQSKEHSFSLQEYQALDHDLTKKLQQGDPSIVLSTLKQIVTKDPSFEEYCHLLLHDIGQKSYLKYHDFAHAMKYQSLLCQGGYVHGVIEGVALNAKNPLQTLTHLCQNYNSQSLTGINCYHGLGHGFMYETHNYVPKSLNLCHSFNYQAERSSCYGGVFMENFLSDNDHPSHYLSSQNPLASCIQNGKTYSECYQYAPIYFYRITPNNTSKIISQCSKAPFIYQFNCFNEIGLIITESHSTIQKSESVCQEAGGIKSLFCISGIAEYLYLNNQHQSDNICDSLNLVNEITCKVALFTYKSEFTN